MSVDPAALRAARLAGKESAARPKRVVVVGCAVLFVLALVVALPQWFATHLPDATDLGATFQPPSAEHLFGTDQLGRDVFSRLIYGTRNSVAIGIGATVLGVGLGALLGLLSGFAGARVDAVLMRIVDVLLSFPEFLLALLVVALIGSGFANVAVAIGIAAIPNYARLVRGQARLIVRSEYVEAAKVLGVRPWRYLLSHVLPNVGGPLVVLASIGFGSAVVAGAGLSVLGLGPRPPQSDWGSMIAEGKDFLQFAWWLPVTPGVLITIVVITVTLIGRHLHVSVLR